MTLGVAQAYGWQAGRLSYGPFVARETVRGVVLIGLHLLLEPVYGQILVVLLWLGWLTIILAPLVPLLVDRPTVALAGALALWVVCPPLTALVGAWLGTPDDPGGALAAVLAVVIAPGPYRLTAFFAHALLGVALSGWLASAVPARRLLAVAATLGAASGAVLLVGKLTPLGGDPYAGTWPEFAGTLLMAAATLTAFRWVWALTTDAARAASSPLVDTGRLALTAYALQLVILRIITDVFLGGGGDDHWWVLATTVAIIVGWAVLWRRLGWPGPLEWVLRRASRW